MKRLISILVFVTIALAFTLNMGYSNIESFANDENDDDSVSQTALVDMVADLIEKRGADDSTIYLVGNVIFHHNGAIIQCDSAMKYSKSNMDFYGHVIINKDSAYIYGDKASYDGRTNIADVYSPIVKLTRGETTLYTYNLHFNTKTNIGYYSGGGTIIHKDSNHMESLEGEYNHNLNEVTFRREVALRSPSYMAKSDSLIYNLDNEVITFLTQTTVWTKDNDILKASEGNVLTSVNTCQLTKDSYILSSDHELWADTMSYLSTLKQVTMLGNIQIVDTTHRTIGYGNWGFWDDSLGNAILTDQPSIRSYNEDRTDTMYVRADSIFMYTLPYGEDSIDYSLMGESFVIADSSAIADSLDISDSSAIADSSIIADTTKKINRIIKGYYNVRGWNKEYQFRCDSIVGYSKDSMGTLFGNTVLWNNINQLKAEQIDVYTENGDLDWADFTGTPIIIQRVIPKHPVLEDSVRFNQAVGNSMQTYFVNNELDSAIMQGNIHNLYWMDNRGYTSALANIECGDLTIFFKNRELRRMRWNSDVDWKIFPLEKIPADQTRTLAGFQWLDSIRPKSAIEISDRITRPSQRENVNNESRPTFLVELGIFSTMKRLVDQKKWTDRDELTTVTPDYFLTH